MLATSERVSPCIARWRGCSLGRETTIWPSFCSMRISGSRSRLSSPLGPLAETCAPSIRTSTPEGIAIGVFPTLDIGLPHVAKDFTDNPAALGFFNTHNALRRRKERDAE